MTPIHIRVPSLILALWWPNIWPKMGFPELFEKLLAQFISYWHLPLSGESLDPYAFSCSWPHFRPSGGQIFGRIWAFRNFLKKLLAQLISYLAFTLMGWVSWPLYIFVLLASILALWWPNIWPKMRFLELFEKTIGPIHLIPGIYLYGVSLLTPIHFHVPSLIFGPLVAKYLAENGVSGTFWKNCWLNKFFLKNSHLCSTRLQNRNPYWIFPDEVGSDQSGGILSPFMGTACYGLVMAYDKINSVCCCIFWWHMVYYCTLSKD